MLENSDLSLPLVLAHAEACAKGLDVALAGANTKGASNGSSIFCGLYEDLSVAKHNGSLGAVES
jgi:hypothetical protein